MENYADYNFYSIEFKGSLSIDLFNSLIIEASREIDRNVNCELTSEVIDALNDRDKWKLKYVACMLCDYFNEVKGGASSISIDGVSISKKASADFIKDKKNILNNLPDELTRYL